MSKITYDEAAGRYEMAFEGGTVFANVRKKDAVVYIDYVEAPVALRGTGAAGTFMHALMGEARNANLKAIPICGYAAGWLRRHTEYEDLVV